MLRCALIVLVQAVLILAAAVALGVAGALLAFPPW